MALAFRKALWRLVLPTLVGLIVAGVGHTLAKADAPASAPASAPATTPSTAPATQPAIPTQAVRRGTLSLELQGEGVFQPVDAFDVRLAFKAFPGPLTITRVASPGAAVKKGDALLEGDAAGINWAVSATESEAASARANLAKAESDSDLGARIDALNLRMQEDAVKNADAAVKWWTDVDGPQMLQTADLQVKAVKDALDDQNDELEQLRKMYKTEELTSATADIVIKRAFRQLENTKVTLKMQEQRRDKTKAFDFEINKQKVADADAQARQQLEALRAAQQQSAILRQGTLTASKLAVEQVSRRLADLKEDQALFFVKAPADGVVLYGQFVDGAWVGGDPKALRPGEKLGAGQTALRLFTPGKLRVQMAVPENQVFWPEQGVKAKIIPISLPQLSYEARSGPVEPAARTANPAPLSFQLSLDAGDVDPRLMPGMKAAVHVDAARIENALLIPLTAVSFGKVSVLKEGHPEPVPVKLGKSDGQSVQVLDGLREGDEVVVPGKK